MITIEDKTTKQTPLWSEIPVGSAVKSKNGNIYIKISEHDAYRLVDKSIHKWVDDSYMDFYKVDLKIEVTLPKENKED